MDERMADRCLSDQEAEDFVFGRLSEAGQARAEEHLLFCEACQERVKREEQFVKDFREAAGRPAVPRRPSAGRWAVFSGVAASLALGVWLTLPAGTGGNEGAAPVLVALSVSRSPAGEQAASIPAGQSATLKLDLDHLPRLDAYEVELASGEGQVLLRKAVSRENGELEAAVGALRPGRYWVRLRGGGELLREYGLRVE